MNDTKVNNYILRALLKKLTIEGDHRKKLNDCGISDDLIILGEYKSLFDSGREDIAHELMSIFDLDILHVPGFFFDSIDTTSGCFGGLRSSYDLFSIAGEAGILVPVRAQDDQIMDLAILRDNVTNGCAYSYLSAACAPDPEAIIWPQVHFPARSACTANSMTETIRLTIGELNSDWLTGVTEIYTLCVPQISNWKLFIPKIKGYEKLKKVLLTFSDEDRQSQEATCLKDAIQSCGYSCKVEPVNLGPIYKLSTSYVEEVTLNLIKSKALKSREKGLRVARSAIKNLIVSSRR